MLGVGEVRWEEEGGDGGRGGGEFAEAQIKPARMKMYLRRLQLR